MGLLGIIISSAYFLPISSPFRPVSRLEELIYELTYTTIILLGLYFLPHPKQKKSIPLSFSLSYSLSLPYLPLSLSRSSEALICYPSVDRWHPFVHYCKDIQVFQTICVDLGCSGVGREILGGGDAGSVIRRKKEFELCVALENLPMDGNVLFV